MKVLFVHLPSPDTKVSGDFSLVWHAFSTIVDSDSHMGYRGFHAIWWKLFADTRALAVFIVFVDIGRQQLRMHVFG
jgi:hypothetical protein